MEKSGLKMNFEYMDSSKIYISDIEYEIPSVQNIDSAKKKLYYESNSADTSLLTFSGSINGKYWKEVATKNLVVGYWDVKKEYKKVYDKTITKFISYLASHSSKKTE